MAHDSALLAHWLLVRSASTDPRLSRSDLAVLIAILERMNDGVAWPGLGTVAIDAAMVRSTVVRSVKQLTATGYLVRESGSRTRSNRYRIGTQARCEVAPRRRSAPRRSDAPGVGANSYTKVGAAAHLEPTYKNPPNEPAYSAEADASRPIDPLWGSGLAFLESKGVAEKQARPFLGKLRKQIGDVQTIALLAQAESDDVIDPIPWLAKAAQQRGRPNLGKLARDTRTEDEQAAATLEAARRFGLEVTA